MAYKLTVAKIKAACRKAIADGTLLAMHATAYQPLHANTKTKMVGNVR